MPEYIGFLTLQPTELLGVIIESCSKPIIAIEGRNLEHYRLQRFGVVVDGDSVTQFSRNTISPKLDFLVLQVTESSKLKLAEELRSNLDAKDFIHVQINQGGQKLFQSNDNFDRLGVYVEENLSRRVISELLQSKVIEGAFSPPDYPE